MASISYVKYQCLPRSLVIKSLITTTTTDNDYLRQVVTSGLDTNHTEEGNLMSSESTDLDDGGAIGDIGDSPITNLQRWGRKVLTVNVNLNITDQVDTIKNVFVT